MEKHESVAARTKNNADAPEQQSTNAVWPIFFFFQSVVAAALFPIVLGRSGGNTLIALWRLSLLLGSYFYSAVCVLHARTRKALLFVFVAYTALLAFVLDAVLSHAAGAVIIYLDSVWMACVFGKALAEHSASGKSAAAAAAAPANENPAAAQETKRLARELNLIMFVVIVLSTRAIIPQCVSVADCSLVSVVVLSTMLCLCLLVAIICALSPLWQGGGGTVVFFRVKCGTGKVLVCWYLSSFMLLTLSFYLVSKLVGVVLLWICVLVLSVFLGYGLRLHAYYVHNMRSKSGMVARPDDEIKRNKLPGQTESYLRPTLSLPSARKFL